MPSDDDEGVGGEEEVVSCQPGQEAGAPEPRWTVDEGTAASKLRHSSEMLAL